MVSGFLQRRIESRDDVVTLILLFQEFIDHLVDDIGMGSEQHIVGCLLDPAFAVGSKSDHMGKYICEGVASVLLAFIICLRDGKRRSVGRKDASPDHMLRLKILSFVVGGIQDVILHLEIKINQVYDEQQEDQPECDGNEEVRPPGLKLTRTVFVIISAIVSAIISAIIAIVSSIISAIIAIVSAIIFIIVIIAAGSVSCATKMFYAGSMGVLRIILIRFIIIVKEEIVRQVRVVIKSPPADHGTDPFLFHPGDQLRSLLIFRLRQICSALCRHVLTHDAADIPAYLKLDIFFGISSFTQISISRCLHHFLPSLVSASSRSRRNSAYRSGSIPLS